MSDRERSTLLRAKTAIEEYAEVESGEAARGLQVAAILVRCMADAAGDADPTTPPRDEAGLGEVGSLDWALAYARTYWHHGDEPESQLALTTLAQYAAHARRLLDPETEEGTAQ